MFEAARKFAAKVILIHLGLLVLIIGVVAYGAYHFYQRALERGVEDAGRRQALLARQTANGIQSYYRSIISDLILLERDEETQAGQPTPQQGRIPMRPPTTRPGDRPGGAGSGRPRQPIRDLVDVRVLAEKALPVNSTTTTLMWRMLQNRVSLLFVYDPSPPPAPPGAPPNDGVIPDMCFPRSELPAAQKLVKRSAEFIDSMLKAKDSAVSSFVEIPELEAQGHLIAVPATGGGAFGDRLLLAFVPLHAIKTSFFDSVNMGSNINAALLDRTGTAMISIDEKMTGRNVLTEISDLDPELAGARRIVEEGAAGTITAWHAAKAGEVKLPPRVIAAEPVNLPGRSWTVLVMAPLGEVEDSVRPVLRGALLWGIVISVAVIAIFSSTAFQLIRSRIRLERTQRDMLTSELRQARDIQLAWLPDVKSSPEGLAVAAMNLPASHISGDFYNYFSLTGSDGRRKIAVCIGDVTGHGMAAAFLMATTQLLIRNTMLRTCDPGACLTEVNRQLCMQPFRGQFVTLLLLVIDPETRVAEVATAGHPGPLIAAGDGTRAGIEFQPLKIEPQFLLGVVEDAVYPKQRFELAPGATMVLYTDGLVEASPLEGGDFGAARMLATLRGEFGSLQAVLDALVDALHRHTKRADLADDVTLVAMQLVK